MRLLDSTAKRFLLVCGLLFVLAFAFRLNGSSTLIWQGVLNDQRNPGGLVAGAPESVRSDEWLVWTPALIAQANRGFPVENPSLGAGRAPFLYSLPVRHYSMVFRPQLYGFFLFDLEWGYSWYWNVKIFGLLISMFLLLWTLSRNSGLALFGSLWLFFSNYIQWWFSCPPMLPEMLSSWALAMVAVLFLIQPRTLAQRIAASVVLLISSVNFVLCLYPPFQIPLAFLGLAIVVTSVVRGYRISIRANWGGLVCLAATLAVAAIALVPFFVELQPTLNLLSTTSYPGQRRSHGGQLTWMQAFSGVMNFFNTEQAFPEKLDQPNGAANFFPLWIPVLACTARSLIREPRKHATAIATLAVLVVLSLYALCPWPDWLCKITLLSFCTEERLLLTVGVANILFVVLTWPLLRQQIAAMSARYFLAVVGAWGCLICLYLWEAEPSNPVFLVPWRILMFFGLAIGLVILLLKTPNKIFAATFIGVLALSNGLVNPVMSGLRPIVAATPARAIQNLIREHPTAAWAAYESNQHSEFLMAMGADVVSGVKTVPDLDFCRRLDPEGHFDSVYNRYSFAFFVFHPNMDEINIRSGGFPVHLVRIHPRNPVLRARNVRYFVFSRALADPQHEGIKLVQGFPENHLWIYDAMPERDALTAR
ncbi:MAG TPA: hypothetical protein VH188_13110 [Chthoniobacterales bacterium]|jgi:hypothetical protein|nr:hypothetical protein [Chthoniobacterales bacterium]